MPTITAAPVIHVAGPYKDLVQYCTRCGEILTDWRNAAYLESDGPPSGIEEGAEWVITGGMGVTFSGLREHMRGLAVACQPKVVGEVVSDTRRGTPDDPFGIW